MEELPDEIWVSPELCPDGDIWGTQDQTEGFVKYTRTTPASVDNVERDALRVFINDARRGKVKLIMQEDGRPDYTVSANKLAAQIELTLQQLEEKTNETRRV